MNAVKVSCGNTSKAGLKESVHLLTGDTDKFSKFVEGIKLRNRLSCLTEAEIMLTL